MCEAPSEAFSAELLVTCCLSGFRAEGCGLGIQGLEDEYLGLGIKGLGQVHT